MSSFSNEKPRPKDNKVFNFSLAKAIKELEPQWKKLESLEPYQLPWESYPCWMRLWNIVITGRFLEKTAILMIIPKFISRLAKEDERKAHRKDMDD